MMADTMLDRHTLKLETATPASLAPFGWMLGSHADIASRPLNFYPGELRAPAEFVSDEQTDLTIVRLQRRPFEIVYLERHFKHTQAFIPLGGKPFLLVMAPPGNDELPPLDGLRAFRFDGSAGFCMRIGCWHEFPFVLEDRTDMIVVLRKETYRNLQNVVGDEAAGDDLDKKNLRRRAGCAIVIDV
jgi:ureidoglycolate lyase